METSPFVVSADWLQGQLGAPDIRVVDASWYLPAQKRNGVDEYASGHIPGAVFFDQDAIANHSTGLAHTVPSPDVFAAEVSRLGICETDRIIVYDGPGIFTAPRVWWLFKIMGAAHVFVLDGGIDGWKKQGRPIEIERPVYRPSVFKARFDQGRVTSLQSMLAAVRDAGSQIADARSAGRFYADDPEPRAELRGGHMPGAKNIPVLTLSRDGRLKSLTELKALFEASGLDLTKPVITTCGSGITAAAITLALYSIGHMDNTLYDGSWAEWGGRDDTPVITGKD